MDLNKIAMECEYKVCKICNVEHKRFRDGVYPNGKDTRFVNESGKEWSGRVCPQCHINKVSNKLKEKREKRKLYV